jgi:hypothetical protein
MCFVFFILTLAIIYFLIDDFMIKINLKVKSYTIGFNKN